MRISSAGRFRRSIPNDWFLVIPSSCRSLPLMSIFTPISSLNRASALIRLSLEKDRLVDCFKRSETDFGAVVMVPGVAIEGRGS